MADRPWEALVEITLYLADQPEFIYCLCSRAFVRNEVNLQDSSTDFEKLDTAVDDDNLDSEGRQTDSELPELPLNKKPDLEAASCYCSASHYSTDDYESAAPLQQNSDSGADLSENLADRLRIKTADDSFNMSGLDSTWERYWADNGESIIWKSWIDRYGAYIHSAYSDVVAEDKLETDPSARVIPDLKVTCLEEGEDEKLLKSDSFGSASGYEKARRGRSRCSNSSFSGKSFANITVTSDSMTNVTKITLSSLDLSCDSNSILSSTSSEPLSGPSSESSIEENSQENDAWWRRVWKQHYEELFSQSYCKFKENYLANHNSLPERRMSSSDDEKALEVVKAQGMSPTYFLQSQLIQKFCGERTGVNEEKSNDDDSTLLRRFGEPINSHSGATETRAKLLGKFGAHMHRENSFRSWSYVNSVGYILQTLNKTSSALSDAKSAVDGVEGEADDTGEKSVSEPPHSAATNSTQVNQTPNSVTYYSSKQCNESDEGENYLRKTEKRKSSHEDAPGKSRRLDRVKAALSLLTLPFQPTDAEPGLVAGHVTYRKRNIRAQNRRLKLTDPRPRVHLFFDDDGNVERQESTPLPSPAAATLENESLGYEAHSSSLEDDVDVVESSYEVAGKKQRKRKRKQRRISGNTSLPLEIMEDKSLLKYWNKRHQLFLKYDEGVRMDAESWFSVTPEKVAAHQAERCRCDVIVDAFCGAGGNAIQLAFTCERVIAIDISPEKIAIAKHNAAIYGVADRIEFIIADFLQIAPTLKADVVFLSPPWGGPQYAKQGVFPLSMLFAPHGGEKLFNVARAISPAVSIFLPRNVNSYELSMLSGPGGAVEIEQNFIDCKLIGVTAYFDELIIDPDNPDMNHDTF